MYAFFTASHGIRRRSAASASRARVRAFSLTRSCSRAASHSCGDTILGVFMACSPSLLVMGSFWRQTSNGGSDKCDAIYVERMEHLSNGTQARWFAVVTLRTTAA